jgi:hypothetical protein
LCEGATEIGALGYWWNNLGAGGPSGPDASNIALIDVRGDASFGNYISYLEAFGIPWAAVADGPALRPGSNLAKQLRNAGLLTRDQLDQEWDFERCRTVWRSVGVFCFADRFGDAQKKDGEFEAYLERLDTNLLAKAQQEMNGSKPLVGTYFATHYPTTPQDVADTYTAMLACMSINGGST